MISLLGCFCCKTFVTGFAKKGPYPANIDFSYCRFYGDGRVLLKLKLLFPWTYQLLYFQFLDSCGCMHFNKANKREEKAACRIPSVRIRKGLLGMLHGALKLLNGTLEFLSSCASGKSNSLHRPGRLRSLWRQRSTCAHGTGGGLFL